jgi:hypothetical protein
LPRREKIANVISVNAPANPFWKQHPGLVWSNPAAGDSVHIQAALLRPRFSRLLDIAVQFGVERVRREWAAVNHADNREAARARAAVERILGHIEQGFSLAASRN